MEERAFNASAVVSYLESHYNLKFERDKESKEPNPFGLSHSYTTLYKGRLEITIDDGEFSDGSGHYVAINTWDKKNLGGVGIPCRDMELILKYIEGYEIEKKTGYEQMTLF